jgi:hypothetical protein
MQGMPFQFTAQLTGGQEVPPTGSPAVGVAGVSFDQGLQTIQVLLAVSNIMQATVAHIHVGPPGQNGPIVLFLYGPAAPMNFTQPTMLTNRSFTAANLVGPLAGQPLSALAREIARGNAYVNVHTVSFPNGEIRGQLSM